VKSLSQTIQIKKTSRGQALLEFALIGSVFLLLIFGVMELGHAYFTYSSLTNAVREGARFAIVNPNNTSGIKNKVTTSGYLTGLTDSNVGVETPGGQPVVASGGPITVTAVFTYHPLINMIIPNVTMHSSSVMIVESVPDP
jgi:Flp pilus assembly protein TadG